MHECQLASSSYRAHPGASWFKKSWHDNDVFLAPVNVGISSVIDRENRDAVASTVYLIEVTPTCAIYKLASGLASTT